MQRFWFTGACEPRKRRRTSSKPLALAQFMSAFLLLGMGISLSVLLLLCERAYFNYLRHFLAGLGKYGWCAMLSLSFADSLKKARVVDAVIDQHCEDSACKNSLHELTQELCKSRARIDHLHSLLEAENKSDLHLVIQTGVTVKHHDIDWEYMPEEDFDEMETVL